MVGNMLFFAYVVFSEEIFHGVVVKSHVVFHFIHVGIVENKGYEEEQHEHYQCVLVSDDYYGGQDCGYG